MSYYYQYEFTSPDQIFANVKEELKSYFDTGSIDDLMFPTYVDKCLRKLGKASYKILEDTLVVEDFIATLPDNFHAIREAWMCTVISGYPYQLPNSFYSQAASQSTIQVSPVTIGGESCSNVDCVDPNCPTCMPLLIQAVYKTTNEIAFTYKKSYLLKPGNISTANQCDVEYNSIWMDEHHNPYGSAIDSFDISNNKFKTNFRNGVVHILFYANENDECGSQMIPDNYRILEFVESFIKYKCFETLFNTINDESWNQIQQKMIYYKGLCDEAYILAEIEIKKQTVWEKQRAIKKSLRRHRRYELPERTIGYTWRRNK